MDLDNLIGRIRRLLLTPKYEWPVIAQEPASVGDLYKNYILILAALPAVLQFLQISVFGVEVPLVGQVRLDIGTGLLAMVLNYGLTLVVVYLMALIVAALAPTFDGQKNQVQALKAVAFAYTASWIASIGLIVPWIGILLALAGVVYSIYLLYLGLPFTTQCPQDKAAGYTAVTILVAIVLGIVVAATVGVAVGLSPMSTRYADSVDREGVQIDKNSALGQLEQYAENMEKAAKKLEAAQESADPQAQQQALAEAMGAALGAGEVESLAPDVLKSFVPESLGGLPRASISVQRNEAMGIQISEANAAFTDDSGRSFEIEITDLAGAKGMLGFAGAVGGEREEQTDSGYEKTFRDNGRLITEKWDRDSSNGEYSIVIADRFVVKVAGEVADIEDLKTVLAELDLAGLERLKGEGVKAN